MNPFLSTLQPYPFEKLKCLTANANIADLSPIAWSIGEPKHEAPDFLKDVLLSNLDGYSKYPATAGMPELKQAIGQWVRRRFLSQHPNKFSDDKHTLPVTGTREALFSVVQALYDPTLPARQVWMPNPFYQIYEGATLLAGGEVKFLNCLPEQAYQPDYQAITDEQWQQCQILFICTPGNPSGTTLSLDTLTFLVNKARQYGFLLISDECYSELYRDESNPPAGLLQACDSLDGHYDQCLVFHSLSKRSNLPGLRSGFVAGDEHRLAQFLQYRTYHGCAMPFPHQQVSIAAWNDETHVIENRRLYNEKYQAVVGELQSVLPVSIPPASFYLWPNLETDDEKTALDWLEKANIRVLPGQYLSRMNNGINPGYGHVRIALVATLDECVEAAMRLKAIL
ncbi:succinyldiaminopimelate transaminase [Reinekea sp. G2M2-21]|uniref:succinyldiaminopimelate transaminase n=1 Tax=Reinekea sp. G2M2-21 TaxID=2788942 RepID=UPI0018AC3F34|nr:succinyldiaminopimelate transaminase [Reinekea sp. G2M2-21]